MSHATNIPPARPGGTLAAEHLPGTQTLLLRLSGRLDSANAGSLWRAAAVFLDKPPPARRLVVDASGVDYCDVSGVAFLTDLRRRWRGPGTSVEIQNLDERFRPLLALLSTDEPPAPPPPAPARLRPLVEGAGASARGLAADLRECVAFSGALAAALALACVRPRRVRWRDALRAAARAGADAVPIVCILGFLMGLIIAFQAAIPMSKLGAEIYVADLVGVATLRELGPLVTCVILAGRTGSAFAAEIGTMRVNEELDALRAMGLDPVAFLAVPRVLAVLAVTPPLALFANLTGIVGAIVVLLSMGYPLSACLNETLSMLRPGDLAGGLLKALVFGLIVAAIGCLRGLQTRDGPDAVGVSATRAVVGGIILIVIADGLFAVLFHCLKI